MNTDDIISKATGGVTFTSQGEREGRRMTMKRCCQTPNGEREREEAGGPRKPGNGDDLDETGGAGGLECRGRGGGTRDTYNDKG